MKKTIQRGRKKKPAKKSPRAPKMLDPSKVVVSVATKKSVATSKPKREEWTRARVQALYKNPNNEPRGSRLLNGDGSTHKGSPHEWEWEEDPTYGPVCLGCNAKGEDVEKFDPSVQRSEHDAPRIARTSFERIADGEDAVDVVREEFGW